MIIECLQPVHNCVRRPSFATSRHWTISCLLSRSVCVNQLRQKRQHLTVRPYRTCSASRQHLRFRRKHSSTRSASCRASLLEVSGFVSGVCFDQQCQQAADRAFLIVTSVPLLGLLCAIILKYKAPSAQALSKEEVSSAAQSLQIHTLLSCS